MAGSDAPAERSRIFISYRREDTQQAVGRLTDDLGKHFPREQIFDDITSIVPGADFVEALQQGLGTCAAMLVVIGPRWLTVSDRQGRRRLDLPGDWVRQEVAESLRHAGVRVFPVLVDDAVMPSEEELPEPLQPLVRRQAFQLTVRHWRHDVERLIEFLKKVPGLASASAAKAKTPGVWSPHFTSIWQGWRGALPKAKLSGVLGAIAALLGLGLYALFHPGDGTEPRPAPAPQEAATPAPMVAVPEAQPHTGVAEFPPKAGTTLKAGENFRDCAQCPTMVVIPAGEFTMGSPDGEAGRDNVEGPQHKVTITRPFGVGKYEVTFDDWDACVAAGGCAHKPKDQGWGRGRQPVIHVSWEDAQAYVSWLSKKTGQPYRLLSEAEWEYAARAGTTTRYPWDDAPGTNRANLIGSGSKWSNKQTAPVGSFDVNQFGLHDMIGNVWEWVQDCWNESYKGAPGDGRAWERGDCGRRVVRGGSWGLRPELARAASRSRDVPGNRLNYLGFRVARTL